MKIRETGTSRTQEEFAVLSAINSLKKKISAARFISIKKKIEENKQKLVDITNYLHKLSTERNTIQISEADQRWQTERQRVSIDRRLVANSNNGNNAINGLGRDHLTSTVLGKSAVVSYATRSIKLPLADRIPRYTTWIPVSRNQRMMHGDSVVDRKRIYYDRRSGEALIMTDDEAEKTNKDEELKEFVESEDYMLRTIIDEFGMSEFVVESLAHCLGREEHEIELRQEKLSNESNALRSTNQEENQEASRDEDNLLNKDLAAALDSFNTLFCRRCFVFDCRVHGCSQNLIPTRKQSPWTPKDREDTPCCQNCYLLLPESERVVPSPHVDVVKKARPSWRKKRKLNKSTRKDRTSSALTVLHRAMAHDKVGANKRKRKRAAERILACIRKRQKAIDSGSIKIIHSKGRRTCNNKKMKDQVVVDKSICNQECLKSWRGIEKELLRKGVETFGESSCLISRNVLNGLKTCSEVFHYLNWHEGKEFDPANPLLEGAKVRSRILRRRRRSVRWRHTYRSAAILRKRRAQRNRHKILQYIPCLCKSSCNTVCSCQQVQNCCEKYCGCAKTCRSRFRGCHCARSQCRSSQCPCFVANRECDPDICTNCWISCGDGTLESPKITDPMHECTNMKIFLKQHQKILLGKSNHWGWGAFVKDSVERDTYLGEYVGELISHNEAERRGRLYDRGDASYLFTLDDQHEIDAYRVGNKLKFANHSSTPNCYAKILLVAGDYRVGIFAAKEIGAREELFYNYGYSLDTAPGWFQKLAESCGLKKKTHPHRASSSKGRARKRA